MAQHELQNSSEADDEVTVVQSFDCLGLSAGEYRYTKPKTVRFAQNKHHIVMGVYTRELQIAYEPANIEKVPFEPSDLLFVSSNKPIDVTLPEDSTIRHLAISESVASEYIHDFESQFDLTFGAISGLVFRSQFITAICDEVFRRRSPVRNIQDAHLNILANAMFMEVLRFGNGAVRQLALQEHVAINKAMSSIDAFIDEHIEQKLTAKKIARGTGLSEFKVREVVKARAGKTIFQYIVHRRIKYAYDLVSTTDLSLTEISYRCGFSSQSHMTSSFRQKLGHPPGKVRHGQF